ncbi:MAG: hypothetical protein ACO2ZD_00645 [Pseudomonadales bacterium]
MLDGTNPSWPAFFLATIVNIINSATGPTYTIAYDTDDFADPEGIPYPCPNPCNVTLECATCCDQMVITADDIEGLCDAVRKCIDDDLNNIIDDSLTINASQVNGLCDAVATCPIDASQLTGLCDAVATCDLTAAQITDFCPAALDCVTDQDGSLLDSITVDPAQITDFCPATLDCVTDQDGSLLDSITVDTAQINDLCAAVVACPIPADSITDFCDRVRTCPVPAENITDLCPEVVDCLSNDGQFLTTLLVSAETQIPDLCPQIIQCVDTNNDGIVDWGLMMPTSLIQDFCQETLTCVQNECQLVADCISALEFDCSALPALA